MHVESVHCSRGRLRLDCSEKNNDESSVFAHHMVNVYTEGEAASVLLLPLNGLQLLWRKNGSLRNKFFPFTLLHSERPKCIQFGLSGCNQIKSRALIREGLIAKGSKQENTKLFPFENKMKKKKTLRTPRTPDLRYLTLSFCLELLSFSRNLNGCDSGALCLK